MIEMQLLTVELLSILFFIAICAGLLDTLAGGGGLISLPTLLMAGVPPLAALGTNKLQGSMGTAMATYLLLKNKKLIWKDISHLMLFSFLGAILGTIAIQFMSTEFLSFVIPVALLFIGTYFLIPPSPKPLAKEIKQSNKLYQHLILPIIGFYDGMFGPGTGSFFTLTTMAYRGYNIIKSTATAKALNFSTNIASLIIFIFSEQLVWEIGVIMMFGQMLGAWIGTTFLFKINPIYLRILVVFVCFAMLTRYAFSEGWIA
jgi:uncharacterized membrane protein YfcA